MYRTVVSGLVLVATVLVLGCSTVEEETPVEKAEEEAGVEEVEEQPKEQTRDIATEVFARFYGRT